MKRWLFVVLTVGLGLLTSQAIVGQSKQGSIQGAWRVAEVTITGPEARTIAFRERPNLTIITARHYSRVEVQADGPRPIPADVTKASADELRAVWGPFVAEAGTYELTTGNLITMRPIASKNPAVMGPGVFNPRRATAVPPGGPAAAGVSARGHRVQSRHDAEPDAGRRPRHR